MKSIRLHEISEESAEKPWKITGYIFAWSFSLAFWAALLLVVSDRLQPFAKLPWPT